eukprot:5087119-Amphidinium_carterae.1
MPNSAALALNMKDHLVVCVDECVRLSAELWINPKRWFLLRLTTRIRINRAVPISGQHPRHNNFP